MIESNELKIYWLSIDAVFESPFFLEGKANDQESLVHGAILEMGITSENEKVAIEFAKKYLEKDSLFEEKEYKLNIENIGIIDKKDLDEEVYADEEVKDSLLQNPLLKGVWYSTGKGFYFDDE